MKDAGHGLAAHMRALRRQIAIRAQKGEAFAHIRLEAVGQNGFLLKPKQHRQRLALRLCACRRVQPGDQRAGQDGRRRQPEEIVA